MSKSNKFSPEVRERAVRMVQERSEEYPSLWAASPVLRLAFPEELVDGLHERRQRFARVRGRRARSVRAGQPSL